MKVTDKTTRHELKSGCYLKKKGEKIHQLIDLSVCGAKLEERTRNSTYKDHAAWFLLDVESGVVQPKGHYDPADFTKEGWTVLAVNEITLN